MRNTQIVLLLLLVALVAIGVYCVHTSPATNSPPAPTPSPPAVHSAAPMQQGGGEDDLMDLVEINDESFGVGGNNGGRYPSEY